VTNKNRKTHRKTARKAARKTPRPVKKTKARRTVSVKTNASKKSSPIHLLNPEAISLDGAAIQEPASGIIIDRIEGETVIGDLIVVFPRTRDVLQKHGLRLDVEHAGDIYMTLDAFAALQGVKAENLIQELNVASREPPPGQQLPQLIAPPTS
jgi:hypothetical protein